MKNLIFAVAAFLLRIVFSDCIAQSTTDLVVGGYSPFYTSKQINGLTIVNKRTNKLSNRKLLDNVGNIDTGGFNLKSVQDNITNDVKISLTDVEKKDFNVGQNMLIVIYIRQNGQIEEATFHIPSGNRITYKVLKKIEDAVLKNRIPIKSYDRTKNIDFVPINIVLRSNQLI
jgi:hypothetical protein